MSQIEEHCGLFGKVPQQADFISYHLESGFTEHWHAWLQSCISVSREQLGDHWMDYYLTSPIWHFALSPGICSHSAITGVLIPSMDEVGRYFPLTLAHIGPHRLWDAYLNGKEWYHEAENIVLSSLDEQTGFTALIEKLESLEVPSFLGLPAYQTKASNSGIDKSYVIPIATDSDPNEAVLGLLDKTYQRTLGSYSLWWTNGSSDIDPCLLVSTDLPGSGQFAAMLDGDWKQWGWTSEQVVQADALPVTPEPEPVLEEDIV